jgi:hypothetical protein
MNENLRLVPESNTCIDLSEPTLLALSLAQRAIARMLCIDGRFGLRSASVLAQPLTERERNGKIAREQIIDLGILIHHPFADEQIEHKVIGVSCHLLQIENRPWQYREIEVRFPNGTSNRFVSNGSWNDPLACNTQW